MLFFVWLMFSSQEMIFDWCMCRCGTGICHYAFVCFRLFLFLSIFLFYLTWEQFPNKYFIDRVWLFISDPVWLTGHKIQLITCDATNSFNWSRGGGRGAAIAHKILISQQIKWTSRYSEPCCLIGSKCSVRWFTNTPWHSHSEAYIQ